jgi:hypothetical protein
MDRRKRDGRKKERKKVMKKISVSGFTYPF